MDNIKWSLGILAEVLLLFVKIIYFIGESLYRMVVPLPEKSLADDIVLVSLKLSKNRLSNFCKD